MIQIKKLKKQWPLFIMLMPAIIIVIIFSYVPMYGIIMAFTDYNPAMGSIFNSNFVRFDNFTRFFKLYNCGDLILNTIRLSIWGIVLTLPLSIIFALIVNELKSHYLKRTLQIVSYAPYFISAVVVCGMIFNFLKKDTGMINNFFSLFGLPRKAYMEEASAFNTIYQISGLWQGIGWSSIVFVGCLSGVDPSIIEASQIDGAGRFKRIWFIKIPSLLPIISIQLIMSIGSIFSVGFEKVYLLQTPLNLTTSETIGTFVYKKSLLAFIPEYGYGTAVGLFNSVANMLLLIIANFTASKLGGESLW